ncbi:amidohydrolase [Altererythrobacter sp. MF3-039]|uniref:amidohydrolase n=1 Tax=Altererythrobacter sp. MF3-039 TaxID=3252901 RepID=UPI00390CB50A
MKRALICGAAFAAIVLASPASADTLGEQVAADMPELMELYRDLHANPELSFEEHETAAKLAARMRALGFEVTEGVGQTGVVSVMHNGDGPTVMLRADMDALPLVERTGLPFASTKTAVPASGVTTGVMHACGHDTHMAGFIGAAQRLVANRDGWQGTLVMILQPAEELGAGAKAMLDDGLFERFPKPDYVFAFHNASAPLPAGAVGAAPGYAMANVDSVDITVKGVGGHGAQPHTTKDPIVLASSIVMKLQTLVSRETHPLDTAVVTVGSFLAGSKHNIIPDEARLQLTVRSYKDEVREALLSGIERIARGEAMAAGLPEELMPVVISKKEYTPSTYNDPELTNALIESFAKRLGQDRVGIMPPTTGGEDFGRYHRADRKNVRSVLFWISGTPAELLEEVAAGEANMPSLHSPFWAPDAEKVIATAAETLAVAAMDMMPVPGA